MSIECLAIIFFKLDTNCADSTASISGLYSCVYEFLDSTVLKWSQWDKMLYLRLTQFEESSSFWSLFLFGMPVKNLVLGLEERILSFLTPTQMILVTAPSFWITIGIIRGFCMRLCWALRLDLQNEQKDIVTDSVKTVWIIQKDVEKSISIVWSQRKWQPAKARCKLLLHGRVGPVLISSWNGLIGVSTPGIKASNTEIHTIHPVSAQCRETGNNWWWMRSERCRNNTRWCLGWQKLIRTCVKKAVINGSEHGNAGPLFTPLWWGLKSKRLFSFSVESRGHTEHIIAIFPLCFFYFINIMISID